MKSIMIYDNEIYNNETKTLGADFWGAMVCSLKAFL